MMRAAVLLLTILLCGLSFAQEAEVDRSAKLRAMEYERADVRGVEIGYKRLGSADAPAVVMIMGLGSSHILWGDQLPYQLADAGYQVVLFDNRDVGASARFDAQGNPILWWELIKNYLGFEVDAAYDLNDMALDTTGLMDVLGIEKGHIIGVSMGGMIAQVIAARYPARAETLISVMSTPGFGDHLPQPGNQVGDLMDSTGETSEAERLAQLERFGLHLDAMPRQIMAILKSGDRAEEVRTISVPTLVLHGEDDTLIPPRHGEYTAELIEGARYHAFEGMAHNMPPAVLPELIRHMLAHMGGSESDIALAQ